MLPLLTFTDDSQILALLALQAFKALIFFIKLKISAQIPNIKIGND
jgi:hypothetical protein